MLIIDLFEKVVSEYPQNIAIVDHNSSLTYSELDSKANKLANKLLESGIKTKQAVGVLAYRDNDYIIAILAILKTNSFYVPLDPKYPDDRLDFIIENSELDFIIGNSDKLKHILDKHKSKKVYLDDPILANISDKRPNRASIDNLSNIYMLFTSGSTGKPKGVLVNHRGVINLVKHFQQNFKPPFGNYNTCQNARLSFDASTLEIWYNLLSGATLYFTPESILLQPNKLRDWIVEKQIREILLVTPIAEMLFDQTFPSDCPFKYLYLGGDALKKLPPADFKAQIVNVYGPTECACITVIETFPKAYNGPITIGKAIINTRTYILDNNLQEVEKGQLGELCLAGDSLGNGYWKLPEQTQQAFVRNKDINARLKEEVIYRTGDLVKELDDGRIDFRGRIDFQVKIRGLRIELDEIEKVLHNHQNIDQTTILALGQGNEKFLVAYYTSKDTNKINQEDLVSYCQQELPDYMVPQFYLHLDKFPLTSNNKVDRKVLEAMDLPKEDKAIIGPENQIQKEILLLWQEYLNLKNISIDDNFFYIGGHSLKAAQIINELQARGYQIELGDFMTNSTIKDLSEIITVSKINQEEIAIIPRDKKYYPITKNQEDLWYLSHLDDSKRAYNIMVKCKFIDNIDEKILIQSLKLIVKIYDSFHSTFKEVDNKIYQFIEAHADLNYQKIEIFTEEELENIITKMQATEFQADKYPLYEIKIIKFNNSLLMLMNIHHLIFDGWSMKVFMDKLNQAYKVLSPDIDESIEIYPRVQNVDYAKWFNNQIVSYQEDLSYWQSILKPYSPTLLLTEDRLKHKFLSHNGKRLWFDIDKRQVDKLKLFAQKNSVSLFSLLLTIYQYVLGEKSERSDISVAFPYANRASKVEEELIGYYTNMVIVRGILFKKDFSTLLKEIHSQVMKGISHSSQAFGDLVKSFNLPLDKSKTELYQAIFVMQNWHGSSEKSIIESEQELGSKTAKTDITLNSEEKANGMEFWLEYNTDLFSDQMIESLRDRFLAIIDNLNPLPLTSNKNTCFIITETSLGIKCAEELINEGFHIYGIITPNKQVSSWAKSKGIYTENLNRKTLTNLLKSFPYDYLFSIVNSMVLDKEILATPIKKAINYHDSLLPKYAGLNASYWAIINNEKVHGISWHLVDEGIDTGDIIVQKEIAIEDDDTSISLNMKCYEAAVTAFVQVVKEIQTDSLTVKKQNFDNRSYFGIDYRCNDCCSIGNKTSLEDARRLYLAGQFGETENPVSTLKVKIGNDFYHIKEAQFIRNDKTDVNKLQIKDSSINLHLANGIISVNEITDLFGKAVDVDSLSKQDIWQEANQIDLDSYQEAVKNELYWLKQLSRFEALELPLNKYKAKQSSQHLKLENPDLATFICFIARLSTQSRFSLVLEDKNTHSLLMNKLPINIVIDFDITVQENISNIQKRLKRLKNKRALLKDLFYRYPQNKYFIEVLNSFEIIDADDLFVTFKNNLQADKILKDVLLIDQKQANLINEWNSREFPLPENKYFLDLFKEALALYPDNIAVEDADKVITYRKLDEESDKLASYLYDEYGQGHFVAISTDRCLEMIIVIIAILKSGNAYLPIDPKYPAQRIKHIIDNSACQIIFTDFSYPNMENLNILSLSNYKDYTSIEENKAVIKGNDLAYVIYTSGTTGKPKGVTVAHNNLINHNLIVMERYDITNKDRVLQFASISFDISVEEIFPCLLAGASLVLRDDAINKSASQFLDFITTKEITIVNLPTAFWHQIAKSLPELTFPDKVKTLIIGGEKASHEIYQHWQEHTTEKLKLFNTYGPTEATIIATIDEGIDDTIGLAMPNTSIHILDRFLKTMPLGIAGSIYIGGKGVTPGYFNNPKLTQEKFIQTSEYGRIYSTGDLGYYYPNGKIKFLGRDDDQIKLNGYRIELSEIENCFTQNTSLNTVFADVKGAKNKRKIVLYYLSSSEIDKDYFLSLANKSLPEYMLPTDYIRISDLPLSPNGKIDKKLLPEPEEEENITNVQAHNLFELKILPLFRQVLGKELGIEDNFFSQGGDSLKAIELIVSLEQVLKMKINSSALYQNPSVRQLALYLQENNQASFSIVTPLQIGDKTLKPLFLTHTTPGDVLGYVNLIHALDNNIPVYGIQSQGLSSEECHTCFKDMITKYVDEILQVQSEGPFHIGGWCYGGVLAFEIGVELQRRGFTDINLYLIETWGRPNTKTRKISYQLRRVSNAISLGPKFWKSYLKTKLNNFSNIHKVLEDDFIDNITDTLGGKSQKDIDKLKKIYRYNIDALNNHTMSDFSGEINLFLAEEPLQGLLPDPEFGWSGMVSKINFYSVKGSHTTVLKLPFVNDISQVISEMLVKKE